jgi:hypothetical protein
VAYVSKALNFFNEQRTSERSGRSALKQAGNRFRRCSTIRSGIAMCVRLVPSVQAHAPRRPNLACPFLRRYFLGRSLELAKDSLSGRDFHITRALLDLSYRIVVHLFSSVFSKEEDAGLRLTSKYLILRSSATRA